MRFVEADEVLVRVIICGGRNGLKTRRARLCERGLPRSQAQAPLDGRRRPEVAFCAYPSPKKCVYELEGRHAAGQAGSGTWRSHCELDETEITRPAAYRDFFTP